MKVLIAAASFASSISGLQRHAFNLVRCLLTLPEITELHLVVAPWQSDLVQAAQVPANSRLTTHIAEMSRGSLARNLWHLRQLPALAARLSVDLVHLSYPVPFDSAAFKCATVVTLHDMYPYEIPMNFGFQKFILNRLILKQCLRNVDAIACVSEATRSQLRTYMSASIWRKASQIPNCVESGTSASTDSPISGWKDEPFLLCVAQHRLNKNIPVLIRAFRNLLRNQGVAPDSKLLIVGMRGPETRKIYRLVDSLQLNRSIRFLEGLPESELQWCYSHCAALVAPSITEGFGLPVAEGLMSGCRIICSDIPAHREIGGEHCRFVPLGEKAVDVLASSIAESLREPKPQPVSLPQFSLAVLAKQNITFYRRVIASAIQKQNLESIGSIGAPASQKHSL